MDASIRRRALEAAAKVALSLTSIAGCGGAIEAAALVPNDAAADGFIDVAAAEPGFCGSPPLGSSTIAEESTVTCCKHYLSGAADASTTAEVASRPEASVCCSAILSHCSIPALRGDCLFYNQVSFICCPLLDNPNVPFCGPWGPPTPPVMPRAHVVGMV